MIKIRKVRDGFISEKQVKNFWGRKRWIPFETYAGLKEPYPFKTYDDCLESALLKIRWDIMRNSR